MTGENHRLEEFTESYTDLQDRVDELERQVNALRGIVEAQVQTQEQTIDQLEALADFGWSPMPSETEPRAFQ